MADIANVIWVGAGAAKAAEASAVTIARTEKVLAQNLPIEEYTEEQGELWDVSVIGSLFWLVTTARNFSTHGNLLLSGEPITRKLHRPNLSIGPDRAIGMWESGEAGITRAPSTQLDAEAYSWSS